MRENNTAVHQYLIFTLYRENELLRMISIHSEKLVEMPPDRLSPIVFSSLLPYARKPNVNAIVSDRLPTRSIPARFPPEIEPPAQ